MGGPCGGLGGLFGGGGGGEGFGWLSDGSDGGPGGCSPLFDGVGVWSGGVSSLSVLWVESDADLSSTLR